MTIINRLGRRAGSDGSMSASGSAGPGFDPRRSSKLSFENIQPQGKEGCRCTLSNRYILHNRPGLNGGFRAQVDQVHF